MVSMKATALANSNTAFIKYWGKYNEKLILPMNGNISMTVDGANTTTTVEFSKDFSEDTLLLNDKKAEGTEIQRVVEHLDLIRSRAKIKEKAKVVSKNNFPTAAGLASSASGFAALTVAACGAANLELTKKDMSILSRMGSGSSCRSIYGGYVEWLMGARSEDSYAVQLADEKWFDLRDIAVVVSKSGRKISTRAGMKESMNTSPFFYPRLSQVWRLLSEVRAGIMNKDLTQIGKAMEEDCLLMHATAFTSKPPIIYWEPATISFIKEVQAWRDEGLEAYFTIDSGANAHVFVLPENANEVKARLKKLDYIIDIIENKPGGDAKLIEKPLF